MESLKAALSRWYIRPAFTALVLVVWFFVADLSLSGIGSALATLSPSAIVAAPVLIFSNLAVGALRWQILVKSYGAPPPRYWSTLHAYVVAGFFNTFLPANVGGDILRANTAAKYFHNPLTPYLLVVIERLLGLSGLFLLAGVTAAASGGLPPLMSAAVIAVGMLSSAAALLLPLWAGQIAPLLSGRARQWLLALPRLSSSPGLFFALGLSALTQALFAGGAFVLVMDVANPSSPFRVFGSLPLALLSLYLPTFAGFGGREAAFAFVLQPFAVSESDAIAASFAFGLAQLATALVGGIALILRKNR